MNVKVKTTAAAMLAAAALVAAPVAADSPGQLGSGPNTFQVKNLTQNGKYANSLDSVACGDQVRYSVALHNTEFGDLPNVTVKVVLGGTSTMTATTGLGGTTGTSGSVTVALASGQTLSYENGSTQLFNGTGSLIKALPDGVTAGGVNVGTLNGSAAEFVDFNAKVNCPAPTPTPTPTPTPAAAPLPQTGPSDLAGLAGIGGTGAIGYAAMAYRRSKRALADKLRDRK